MNTAIVMGPEKNLLALDPQVLKRFLAKVDRSKGPIPCWLWKGYVSPSTGYGSYNVQAKKTWRSHRLMYELTFGPIPEGMHLHHVCGNRACANPWHVMVVTPGEHWTNLSPGSVSYINARKTHCPRGHEYTPENTLYTKRGHRHCRECNRLACGARFEKFRAANPIPEQTHCLRGHPLSGSNIRLRDLPSGGVARRCLACAREKEQEKRAAAKLAASAVKDLAVQSGY
jgi:hypothetical protein